MEMFKKVLLAVATLIATMGVALAQVDINKADQAALDGVRGIGPKLSKTILDERKKNGNFKDWADLESRVKGVGPKSAARLSANGLTVNGQALTASGAAASASASASAAKGDGKAKAPKSAKKEGA